MSATNQGSTLLRSLASSWLGLAVGVAVSFFLSPFVVNKLGAAWYGVWAISAQFVGYLYLMDFGVRESVIRYTSKYAARHNGAALNRVLSVALTIYGVITILALAVTGLAVWGLPHWFSLEPEYWHDGRLALAFTGLTIAQTFFFNVFNGVVLGLKRWELTNVLGIGLNLVRATLIVISLVGEGGIVAVAVVTFAVALLGGIINAFIALRLLQNAALPFSYARLRSRAMVALGRRILSYGFYVIINNVGEKIITATDAIVAGVFLPIQSVTHLAIAGSLVGYLRTLLGTSAQIFNPLASELHSLRERAKVTEAFLLGVKICTLITAPIAACFVILGEQFIGLWMGPEFAAPSSSVLTILALATFFSAPQYMFASVLYGVSRHKVVALLRIVEAAANLVLSIALVRSIGLVGVALGTAIPSAIVVMLVLPAIAGRMVGAGMLQFYECAYIRPLLGITPFAIAAYWIRDAYPAIDLPGFFFRVGALLLFYAPCAFVLVLDRTERTLVLIRLRRIPGFS